MKKKILLVLTALSLILLTACTAPVSEPAQTTTTQPVSENLTTTNPPPSTTQPETESTSAAPPPSSVPESKAVSQQPTSAKEVKTSAQQKNTSQTAEISKEKAIETALAHAKVNPPDAKFVEAEIDFDRNVKHYDVEFKAAGFEYDYEIDIETGKVLKAEKEFDD